MPKEQSTHETLPSLVSANIVTIEAHFLEQQRAHPEATGTLTSILYDIALSGKIIAHAMTRAGLIDVLGMTGTVNIQGEQVAKLDRLANETLVDSAPMELVPGLEGLPLPRRGSQPRRQNDSPHSG